MLRRIADDGKRRASNGKWCDRGATPHSACAAETNSVLRGRGLFFSSRVARRPCVHRQQAWNAAQNAHEKVLLEGRNWNITNTLQVTLIRDAILKQGKKFEEAKCEFDKLYAGHEAAYKAALEVGSTS
ncbi:hypothetical protein [Caballeronia grimmiae]|uniref:hypothetical protein n=1 Tax=Caballeronia grimmiae TaxID=1071679 RepID=UPI0038BC329A